MVWVERTPPGVQGGLGGVGDRDTAWGAGWAGFCGLGAHPLGCRMAHTYGVKKLFSTFRARGCAGGD